MFRSLVCGSSHGKEEEEEEQDDDKPGVDKSTSLPIPRRQRKQLFFRRRNDRSMENPYSSSGLDKFSSLVADLEEKRERISSKDRETMLVRFAYSSTNNLVPVVVKARSRNKYSREEMKRGDCIRDTHPIVTSCSRSLEEPSGATEEVEEAGSEAGKSKKGSEAEPSLHVAAVVIQILILLAFFGRPVVILCSSVAWYMVPAIRGSRSNLRNSTKRKQ